MKKIDALLFEWIFDPIAHYFYHHTNKQRSIFFLSYFFGIILILINFAKCFVYNKGIILLPFDLFEILTTILTVIFLPIYARYKIKKLSQKGGENPLKYRWRKSRIFCLWLILIVSIIAIIPTVIKREFLAYLVLIIFNLSFIFFVYFLCSNPNSNSNNEDENFLPQTT